MKNRKNRYAWFLANYFREMPWLDIDNSHVHGKFFDLHMWFRLVLVEDSAYDIYTGDTFEFIKS